ncbi:hypothetical protein TRICI_006773 [Trichomonascus ciferrii]|uniref:Uncharacterized protein n=1 Tax=Trichomonascus ciferrii TaxID=44093 RepID=A0A642UDB4_9ASCO|nr:hypothetical protein TRICI_006773 [Trichomonascus ciferrii]
MSVSPDEIVDHLLECLAFNGDEGASVPDLWDFAREKTEIVDDSHKELVWKWLLSQKGHVAVASRDRLLEEHELVAGISELEAQFGQDQLRIFASEEEQWIRLTGNTKVGNPIGHHPFKLLCAVSRSRSRGLTTVELAKETGQDPRSLFGRITLLMEYGLLQRFPVVHAGMSTHLMVFKKFIQNNREASNPRGRVGIDMNQLRKAIVDGVKNARNGLRQHDDLKMELGFDKNRRSQVIFAATIRDLESQGYVQRVMVRRTGYENEKFRCIKFLKDLTELDQVDSCDEEEDEMFDEADEGEKEEPSGNAGSTESPEPQPQATSNDGDGEMLDTSDLIKIDEDNNNTAHKHITFNQFYPLESQIYTVTSQGGEYGVPAMDLCRKIVGATYGRIFSRLLDCLVDKPPGKGGSNKKVKPGQPPHLEYLNIIRGIDFSARMKFYRYFTQVAYCAYVSKEPSEVWGSFKIADLKGSSRTFSALESSHKKKLPGLVDVYEENGKLVPLFHGEKSKVSGDSTIKTPKVTKPKPASSTATPSATGTGKKRGRPRKRPYDENGKPIKKPRKSKKSDVLETPDHSVYDTSLLSNNGATSALLPHNDPSLLNVDSTISDIPVDTSLTDRMVADSLMVDSSPSHSQLPPPPPPPHQAPAAGSSAVNAVHIDGGDSPMLENPPSSSTPLQQPPQPLSIPEQDNEQTKADEPTLVHFNTMPEPEPAPDAEAEAESAQADEQGDVQMLGETPTPGERSKEPIYRSFPTDGLERKPRAPKKKKNFSFRTDMWFANDKRQSRILEILKEGNGVIEGGMALVKKFSEKYPEASQIDRKTIDRNVESLVVAGKCRQVFVCVPNSRGVPITKYIVIDVDIDPNSQQVEDAKQKVIQFVKKKPAPPPNGYSIIAVEDNDFTYYYDKEKNNKPSRKSSRAAFKKTGAMSRLAKTDIERNKKRDEKEAREEQRRKEKEEKRQKRRSNFINSTVEITSAPGSIPPQFNKIKETRPSYGEPIPESLREGVRQTVRDLRGEAPADEPQVGASVDDHSPVAGSARKARAEKKYTKRNMAKNSDMLIALPGMMKRKRTHPSQKKSRSRKKDSENGEEVRTARRLRTNDKCDPEMFYRIVVIVRSVFYNVQGLISWDKVVQFLPMFTVEQAKSKWPRYRDMFGGTAYLAKATHRFESLLLKSYESGELPIMDEDNLDIFFLASFWRSKDRDSNESTTPWLYSTREDIESNYIYFPGDDPEPLERLLTAPSLTKHEEFIVNRSFGYDPIPDVRPELNDYQKLLKTAKQSIKAIISTDDDVYNENNARQVLENLGEQVCMDAVKELEAEKSITYVPRARENFAPGRNFAFSDKFLQSLQTRYPSDIFDDATHFEEGLISAISSQKGLIMSQTAPDSSLVCILDLICHRKIDLVRINAATGMILRESYDTRNLDKDKLDCDIVLRSKEGVNLENLGRPDIPPPLTKPCESIWTDVNGNLSTRVFNQLIRYILLSVCFRPGVPSYRLHTRLSHVITIEEVELILQWLEQKQIISSGPANGHWIQPRWYSHIYVN